MCVWETTELINYSHKIHSCIFSSRFYANRIFNANLFNYLYALVALTFALVARTMKFGNQIWIRRSNRMRGWMRHRSGSFRLIIFFIPDKLRPRDASKVLKQHRADCLNVHTNISIGIGENPRAKRTFSRFFRSQSLRCGYVCIRYSQCIALILLRLRMKCAFYSTRQ